MSHPTIRDRIVTAAESIPIGQEFSIDDIQGLVGGKFVPTRYEVAYHLGASGVAKRTSPGTWVREGEQ